MNFMMLGTVVVMFHNCQEAAETQGNGEAIYKKIKSNDRRTGLRRKQPGGVRLKGRIEIGSSCVIQIRIISCLLSIGLKGRWNDHKSSRNFGDERLKVQAYQEKSLRMFIKEKFLY
jgi:hypothetical protein